MSIPLSLWVSKRCKYESSRINFERMIFLTNIKVFLDYACPFCYLGFSIAEKLHEERPDIKFEFFPYELDADAPQEPSLLTDYIDEDTVKSSYERIERLGSEYGLDYSNKYQRFNTRRLLMAGMYSKKEEKFYEFSRLAFKAIFEDGKNVAKAEIVNEIGLEAGLNIVEMNNCINGDSLDDEMERAKNLIPVYEVDSVPTFIVNDKKKVTKLKPYAEFKSDLLD